MINIEQISKHQKPRLGYHFVHKAKSMESTRLRKEEKKKEKKEEKTSINATLNCEKLQRRMNQNRKQKAQLH